MKDLIITALSILTIFAVATLVVIWLGAGLVTFGLFNAFSAAILTAVWFIMINATDVLIESVII